MPREDHASYLAHWIAVLKEGKRRMIAGAAAHAQKAVDYLRQLAAEGRFPSPRPKPQ